MTHIAVCTFARSEFSSILPLLKKLRAANTFHVSIIASGTHLCPAFGHSVVEIEREGFAIDDRIEMQLASDTPEGISKSVGLGVIGFGQSLSRLKPDLLILAGDRFELLSVASAALFHRIPIAHISGGDITEGAIDNQVRYAVTQMSHLHFVSMAEHGRRLELMGEEPWRIHVTGDPALDLLEDLDYLSRKELEDSLGLALNGQIVVSTIHPATLTCNDPTEEVDAILKALNELDGTFIFFKPNADMGGQAILERLQAYTSSRKNCCLVDNLGQRRYYSLLSLADVMVGNSSSGIWEAPSFKLPVVNVGERQRGRLKASNVLDTPADPGAVLQSLRKALSEPFRKSLNDIVNPYGDGKASERIVEALQQVATLDSLLLKRCCLKL